VLSEHPGQGGEGKTRKRRRRLIIDFWIINFRTLRARRRGRGKAGLEGGFSKSHHQKRCIIRSQGIIKRV